MRLAAVVAVVLFVMSDASAQAASAPVIPRVWWDKAANVYHAPSCKLVKPGMMKLARTAAKMQGIPPAPECAQTDAQAREEWKRIVATDPAAASPGRFSESSGSVDGPTTKSTARSASSSTSRSTTKTKTPPTWNEFMAATDYGDAEAAALQKCNSDWASSPTMQEYCVRKQREAIRDLRNRNGSLGNQEKRIQCAKDWPNDYRMRVYCEGRP